MKITLLTPALVAMLGLALAGAPATALAQTSTNSPTASAPAKKPKPIPYSGSITAIDAGSVTVANTQKTLTLSITPKTKFKKDKVVATAADFAVGDKITGSFSTDETGAMTANSIHKMTPKMPAAAPAAAPAPAAPATPPTQ